MLQVRTLRYMFIISLMLVAMMMSQAFCEASFATLSPNAETAFNTSNLIRLHIMANSNSVDDQVLKMAIRDVVLREAKRLLIETTTKSEVWQTLSESITRIEKTAQDEVRNSGKPYEVTVELGTFSFPACSYGDFHVPAGDYDALRVVLGSGAGRNWWCVLFPPLCFIEVADDGRIRGLDTNTSPGEALLKLNLNLKASPGMTWTYDAVAKIPVVEMFTFPTHLSLSLKDLL